MREGKGGGGTLEEEGEGEGRRRRRTTEEGGLAPCSAGPWSPTWSSGSTPSHHLNRLAHAPGKETKGEQVVKDPIWRPAFALTGLWS